MVLHQQRREKMKQSRLFDYPSEKVKRSPRARVIRPPRSYEERIITIRRVHREVPAVAEVSEEQAEEYRELRRKGIEYHQSEE